MRRISLRALPLLALAACAPAAPARLPAPASMPVDAALAVATFDSAWTRVLRHHYDTTFGGLDWLAVRAELRPRVEAADSEAEVRTAILDMVGRLGVSHYTLIPREASAALAPEAQDPRAGAAAQEGGPADAGLEVRIAEGKLVAWRVQAGGAAAAAGLTPGEEVSEIAGADLRAALDRVAVLEDARERQVAETRFLHGVNAMLSGTLGDTVEVHRAVAGGRATLALPLRASGAQLIKLGNLPPMVAKLRQERRAVDGGCVGVITLSVWMAPLAAGLDRAIDELRECRGMVLDLRGNPGGVAGMVMGVGGHFVDSAQALGTMRTRGTELRFVVNPRRANVRGQPVPVYDGALAVLVDAMSASTSEIFAAGMQAIGRARVFGQVSAGQALPAMAGRLPNGDVLLHAIADYVVIDGTRVEGRGVIPDELLPLRIEDLRAGHDAPLEAALRWIAQSPGT